MDSVDSVTFAADRPESPTATAVTLRVVGVAAAATLAIDAYVHLHDAAFYDSVRSSVLSQGTLFRAQAALAMAVGIALLLRPRLLIWVAALVVVASALGAVVLYRYVDVGALGPLPNMYEPTWVLPGKLASAWAEGAGTVLSVVGLVVALGVGRAGRRRHHLIPDGG